MERKPRAKWQRRAPAMPSFRAIYDAGVEAFRNDLDLEDNPNPTETAYADFWRDGWTDARNRARRTKRLI